MGKGSINKVILMGRLGRDPELSYVGGKNTPLCKMALATTDGFGENEKTNWHDVEVWGKTAEAAAKYLVKGSQALVEGHMDYDTYEAKDGGGKRRSARVKAFNVQFMDKKADGDSGGGASDGGSGSGAGGDDGELPF